MAWQDPYQVLGLEKGADKQEVKQAFRRLAMKLHPDLNPEPSAAEEYNRVKKAADAILNKVEVKPDVATSTSARAASWSPRAINRNPRFPLYFSFACLLGGCIIFAGALHSHTQLFDGYSYNILQESERRRENPSPGQQRIIDLLVEKKEQSKFER